MASGVEHSELKKIVNIMGDETSCPVCLEEFKEPKCLPSCAHNVCERCLENMVRKGSYTISCPQCREESFLPPTGVSSFPTNHLLLRLIENTPARKEKKELTEALNVCYERVKAAENALQEMEECYENATDQRDKIRGEINKLADDLIQTISKQRNSLLCRLDDFLAEHFDENSVEKQQVSMRSYLREAKTYLHGANEILQQGEIGKIIESKIVVLERLKEISSTIDGRTLEAKKLSYQVDIDFSHSPFPELRESCVEMLGRLSLSASNFGSAMANATGFINYSRCEEESRTIVTGFSTFAMAVSNVSGDIALLDEEDRRVYIFNNSFGDIVSEFCVNYGDLWDVTFSKDDEIIVLSRECNRLLHYDREGTFIKKHVKTPNAQVKFTRISTDADGRFLITSSPRDCCDDPEELVEPCVLVYSSDRKFLFSFGVDRLHCPQDVVFHQGKFFVTDGDLECVQVFNSWGKFLFEFGSRVLLDPIGVTVDPMNNVVLICDSSSNAIVVFKPNGELVSEIETSEEPLHVALSLNARSLIVCFHNTPFLKVLSNEE